jgi:hypothetical protein
LMIDITYFNIVFSKKFCSQNIPKDPQQGRLFQFTLDFLYFLCVLHYSLGRSIGMSHRDYNIII